MRTSGVVALAVACILALVAADVSAAPVGTSFVYQGQLMHDGAPLTGVVDLTFALFDDETAGTQVGTTYVVTDVDVANGLFTVEVDFEAGIFTGDRLWLVVSLRSPAGGGPYRVLTPRQVIRPTPYALALPHLRTEFHSVSPNVLGGHGANVIPNNIRGGTIAGGGRASLPNRVTDHYGVVGGGYNNQAGDDAGTTDDANFATVSGGVGNLAGGSRSAIGGGQSNLASGDGGSIAGGQDNTAGGIASAVGGGQDNTANGDQATVPGGSSNEAAGRNSFAAGSNAKALHHGTFVWADEQAASFESTADHQFLIRASGGVGIGTNTPIAQLNVVKIAETDAAIIGEAAHTIGELGRMTVGVQGTFLQNGNKGQLGAFGGGVVGTTSVSSSAGVLGTHTAVDDDAAGVRGENMAATGFGVGVIGRGGRTGVLGEVTDGPFAPPAAYVGVEGNATGGSGTNVGVVGKADGSAYCNFGVLGEVWDSGGANSLNIGVFGSAPSWQGYAGYFEGDTTVTGTLAKGAGAFKIDHPLDPANKYLYHSFVESPDMMNVYNGNVVTDGDGEAVVTLPEWFDAVNREFRYQLTVIGQFAQAIVAKEIKDNRFAIQTDKPNVKVSWQVTGIRKDPYAEAHRIPLEVDKPEHERGRYLHPEARGLPKELRLHYEVSRGRRTLSEQNLGPEDAASDAPPATVED